MLKLYVKTGCPYCAAVLHKIDELNIEFEELNISDDAVAAELVEKGGKRQVPYMIDGERNTAMYESGDIVNYLEEHFGKGEGSEGESSEENKTQDSGTCSV